MPVLTALELESNGLYEAFLCAVKGTSAPLTTAESQRLWHERLGHTGRGIIQNSIPLVYGMNISSASSLPEFESCEKGKSKRDSRKTANMDSRMYTKPLDLVHTDIVGPIQHVSPGEARYFIRLYDDSSALSFVRFIRT